MLIKNLPSKLQAIAWEHYEKYRKAHSMTIEPDGHVGHFRWSDTPEGDSFWSNIEYTGEIPEEWKEAFYEIY